MDTLQHNLRIANKSELLRSLSSFGGDDFLNAKLTAMIDAPDIAPDPNHVLFAAAFCGWGLPPRSGPFNAAVYNVPANDSEGIIFSSVDKVLGYLVSDMSIEQFGRERVLTAILEELMFIDGGVDVSDYVGDIEDAQLSFTAMLADMGVGAKDLELPEEDKSRLNLIWEANMNIRQANFAGIRAALANL